MYAGIVAGAAFALAVAQAQGTEAPEPSSQGEAAAVAEAERQRRLEEDIAQELGAAARPGAPAAAPERRGNPYARLLAMPDLSAIGNFAAAWNDYDVESLSPRTGSFAPEGEVRPIFEELELGLQAAVDPYARADVFIAFGPDEIAVEEAYLTSLRLPLGFQARVGKLFSPFGRINAQHPHVWEFPDAPLARGRLLAEEVLAGPGLEVGWLAPVPWFLEFRFAGQATAPGEEDEERLTGVARILQYVNLGEATTVGLGVSGAVRNDPGRVERQLGGVDAHLRFRRLESRSYLSLQGELFAQRLRDGEGDAETGWYAQAFWRAGPYGGLGVRYDDAPAAGDAAPGTERRVTALGTWFLSEFQRLRLQVAYDRRPGGEDGLEAMLHVQFGIGAHGAHPF